MLVSNKTKRDFSQWPVKEAPCHGGCGKRIQYKLKPKKFCDRCDEKFGSQSRTARATRLWRKRRADGFVGFPFKCAVCGGEHVGRVPHSKWCDACRREGRRRQSTERNAALGMVPFGTNFACKNCSAAVVKKHRTQHYCEVCSALSKADSLPAYSERKRTYFARYGKLRRAADPSYAIRCRMTANINNSLRLGKGGRSWEALVGFTLSDLMAHLEAQFLPGMSWDNRGDWHIDHIRPLCSFEFQTPDCPQFREAWALTNLRPLWAADNLRKGGRWLPPAQ